jgi:hypothetical protein
MDCQRQLLQPSLDAKFNGFAAPRSQAPRGKLPTNFPGWFFPGW